MNPSFDAAWLALREPADHLARSAALLSPLDDRWRALGWTRILDLGSGTGSSLRYLSPRLSIPQEWTLLDRDPVLLSQAAAPRVGVTLTRIAGELADEGLERVRTAHLVTASALLDLVSERWLQELTFACCSAGCGILFTLNYDGGISWANDGIGGEEDGDPRDELVRDAVNLHQHRDKGLGPALGPDATPVAEALFRDAGYETWSAASPWRLGRQDAELVAALIEGWEMAASEQRPEDAHHIRAWAERRKRSVWAADFGLQVGHFDLLALPSISA